MTYLDDTVSTVLRSLADTDEPDAATLASDLWEAGYLGLANDADALADIAELWPQLNANETTVHQWVEYEETVKSLMLSTILRVRANAEADIRFRIQTALASYASE